VASVEFDTSQVDAFAQDLARAGAELERKAEPVIERGALNIKNQLVDEMSASRHFRAVARSISYDRDGLEAEIGPEKGAPGSLANIAYFGSSRGGGTVPDPIHALEAEVPNVERWLAEVAEDSL